MKSSYGTIPAAIVNPKRRTPKSEKWVGMAGVTVLIKWNKRPTRRNLNVSERLTIGNRHNGIATIMNWYN